MTASGPARDAVALRATNLSFFYGATQALKDINLPVHRGKVTSIIGPSGCGKSTLLRIFNRIYMLYPGQTAAGEVLFEGRNILAPGEDLNLLRARIGMLFQRPTPFPMSIYDNIAFGIRLYEKLHRDELDGRVRTVLERVSLWHEAKDRLHKSALALSGGQQQRLCIARSIALDPEVLLLDEPTAALDPISTARIEALIDELKARHTIVIVTHNMQQAARCSDYTGYMYLGELVEFAVTDVIFRDPRKTDTRNYVTGRFG